MCHLINWEWLWNTYQQSHDKTIFKNQNELEDNDGETKQMPYK